MRNEAVRQHDGRIGIAPGEHHAVRTLAAAGDHIAEHDATAAGAGHEPVQVFPFAPG
jgi:hypothetical protein